MKKLLLTLLCGLFMLHTFNLQAQYDGKLDKKPASPVLLDDAHKLSHSMALEKLQNEKGSVLGKIDGLTTKQQSKILSIEKCRDRKLKYNAKKMLKYKAKLSKQLKSDATNSKKVDKIKNSISKLVVGKQAIKMKALSKIQAILSPEQLKQL